jgi:serine O-acetyltransferase
MKHEINARIKYLVDILSKSYRDQAGIIKVDTGNQLNRSVIIGIIEKLKALIFPGYFGKKHLSADLIEYYSGDILEEVIFDLSPQAARAFRHLEENEIAPEESIRKKADHVVFSFLEKLPELREYLALDVSAAFEGDPAAHSRDEIISSYPGISAIMVYRLAHTLHDLGLPLIPRIMTEHAHSLTGIDIHPGAVIGHHFFIDHGTGIVIGETTVIGNFVKIYQGVTLGGLSTRGGQSLRGTKRHPTIEDHVTIYSGASILGGTTVIGEGVVIGSNAFVTRSVPEKTKVSVKNPELRFKAGENQKAEYIELSQEQFWDWVI